VPTSQTLDPKPYILHPKQIKVASYDYWESCQWDEVVNEEMMAKNHEDLADMVRRSVVEWGIAAPSYPRLGVPLTEEDRRQDARLAPQP
jgi:hypothetical protein